MNILRRVLLLLCMGTLVVCVVLLLNFTALNPTGRRYSSYIPTENFRGRDGGDAERILSLDLDVPQNTITEPRQCICDSGYTNSLPHGGCDVCTIASDIEDYYIPDFFTDEFIGEAKNWSPGSGEVYSGRNSRQINAFLSMARELNRPFWLYVAVDSVVSPELRTLAESTGGGVIYYFTVPGYVDPIDAAAKSGIALSGGVFVLCALWEVWGLRRLRIRRRIPKEPAPKSPPTPRDPIGKAARSVQNAEQFNTQSRETARNELDQKEAHEEWRGDE